MSMCVQLTFVLLTWIAVSVHGKEYCTNEVFRAECPAGKVIKMKTALYGQMKLGRCITSATGPLGCLKDVIEEMDGNCSGMRVCEISVVDGAFEGSSPCFDRTKNYLEADYECNSGGDVPVSSFASTVVAPALGVSLMISAFTIATNALF